MADGDIDDQTQRIVRVGGTVRRPAGYWTPAVHLLLRHLEQVGFEQAPRVIGMDAGTEILSFVQGDTPTKESADWMGDDVLASVGRLLRRYHDAVASFSPPAWARWQPTSIPTTGTLVCHNDLYPGNVVLRGRQAVGIIDFDFAHPSDKLWDLAMAAWHWVPLSVESMGDGIPESARPARFRLLVDAYGIEPRRREEVFFITADLCRRMLGNHAEEELNATRIALSLRWPERHRASLLDALQ